VASDDPPKLLLQRKARWKEYRLAQYQFQIMLSMDVPRQDILLDFANTGFTYFPPLAKSDPSGVWPSGGLALFFITTDINPYYDLLFAGTNIKAG
jgi:hypothetical protein